LFVVRPIRKADLNNLYKLSAMARAGLTTLPHRKDLLKKRIEESVHSFRRNANKPGGESYFFCHGRYQDQSIGWDVCVFF